jgi:hypothetical protein
MENWVHALLMIGLFGVAGALVVVGVVMNAITAGFRELAVLQRRSR